VSGVLGKHRRARGISTLRGNSAGFAARLAGSLVVNNIGRRRAGINVII
jgi:hypothetical protein